MEFVEFVGQEPNNSVYLAPLVTEVVLSSILLVDILPHQILCS